MLEHLIGTLPCFDKFNSWLNQSSDNTFIALCAEDNALLINAHATQIKKHAPEKVSS